jgi:hypothetical protein
MSVRKQLGLQSLFSLLVVPVFLIALLAFGLGGSGEKKRAAEANFTPLSFEEVAAQHPQTGEARKTIVFYLYDAPDQIAAAAGDEESLVAQALVNGEPLPNRSYDFYNVADPAEELRIMQVIGITTREMEDLGTADVLVIDLRPQCC